MARKKSIKKVARRFCDDTEDLSTFLSVVSKNQKDEHVSMLYNYAIIRLYREFETLILHAIVGAINNDTRTLSEATGTEFPKHLTDEICEYLITGTGYFDFKGRDGLIKKLKDYVRDDHYLIKIVKKHEYKGAIEQLSTLRNFAAHESAPSKKKALAVIGQKRMGSAGSWLKREDRFGSIKNKLKELAREMETAAPY
jgi:cupin superfamily acireductone dioxygenase involved in methionine salvage